MPQDLTDDKSTLVQVMAWCRQATSHYLSQGWPRFMLPYGVTRPQWVKFCCFDGLKYVWWIPSLLRYLVGLGVECYVSNKTSVNSLISAVVMILTQLSLNKMGYIWHTTLFLFLIENVYIWNDISLKYDFESSIVDESTLVQIWLGAIWYD